MEMTPDTIKALLDAFDRSDWREMTVMVGSDRLHVSRDPSPNGAQPLEAIPPAEPAAAAAELASDTPSPDRALVPEAAPRDPTPAGAEPTADGTVIESPSVGLFWRAPSPGAPPFVVVGQRVSAGDTVAIVEVMKLMNHVASPADGVVVQILVENGAPVEFGQGIVVVDPEG
jgi:acetyl-CoA carboxylase biotin carboxyl carrier protein